MSNALTCMNEQALSVGSLNSYIHWANKIPLLTAEEEVDLANRLKYNDDLEAARQLVMSHLRLVVRIARGFSGYGLSQADLIQEGNVGLMKAVKRFDADVGVRLVSFAIHWIRAEMHEFILKNWRIVKVATTKTQRKLFFNLRRQAKKRGWFSPEEVNLVASTLNVSHKDVQKMEMRLNSRDEAFDGADDSSAADTTYQFAPAQYLQDRRANPATQVEALEWSTDREKRLYLALEKLDPRSQDILKRRWLSDEKETLHDLAAEFSISAERVRQLEANAMKKIKAML